MASINGTRGASCAEIRGGVCRPPPPITPNLLKKRGDFFIAFFLLFLFPIPVRLVFHQLECEHEELECEHEEQGRRPASEGRRPASGGRGRRGLGVLVPLSSARRIETTSAPPLRPRNSGPASPGAREQTARAHRFVHTRPTFNPGVVSGREKNCERRRWRPTAR